MVAVSFLCASCWCGLSRDAGAQDLTNIDEYLYPSGQEAKTISMDFKDAQLNDALKILSQQSGMNFIASQEVSGKTLSIYLDKVPIEEALERILSSNNLTYEIKPGSNIFIVRPLDKPVKQLITRVYRLKYATVVSSKLNQTLTLEQGGNASVSSGESSQGIVAALKAMVTPDGKVVEDSRTNSLIVTDIPSQFPLIEQTIARLDVKVPQILIEVEMLDISKTTADLLGAKFGDTPMTFTGAERNTLYPFDRNKAMANVGKIGNQGFLFEEQGLDEYNVGTLSFAGLTMTLQFLRTQSDTRNLARPRILTLDNETAEISIKTNEAIGLASTTTSSQSTAVSVSQAERVDTGIFLRVTPQADVDNDEITMAIEPRVIQARTGQTFGSQTFKDPEERGTKSILRVLDGDTIVLGGLLRTNVEETRTSVPFLGDIPVLGAAFRHKDKDEAQRELIIFITPHIIQEDLASGLPSARIPEMVFQKNIPSVRVEEINKELSRFEQKGF